MSNSDLSLHPLIKALASLQGALVKSPLSDLERDGAIQRFEYTFELAWKTGKRVLEHQGIVSLSPRTVIRDMAGQGWIADAPAWLRFLKARNDTSHTYKEEVAKAVFASATEFAAACATLVRALSAVDAAGR